MSTSTAVVGGGLLGLSIALRLAEGGDAVTVYEAAPELGGLAAAWDLGGFRCDQHYHVILPSDQNTIELLRRVGLDDSIEWRSVRTGLFSADGTLSDASDAMTFLRNAPMGAVAKARLGATVAAALAHRHGAKLEQVGVEPWLRRWSGDRAFESFWLPLLKAKLGDGYQDASAAFIWATLRRLLAARRSGMADQQVGYLPGGWGPAIDRLVAACVDAGVTVQPGTAVRYVRPSRLRAGFDVIDQRWTTTPADRVVVTLAAGQAAAICPDLSALEHDRLARVRYQGLVCVAALLDRPLSGYYLTNITDPKAPVTGVVEMTALIDPAELGGRTLVYLPRYVAAGHRLFGQSDEVITAEFLDYLWQLYPDARSTPVATRVSRRREVFAVPTIGYSERMPRLTTSLPGLYLAGSAQLPFAPLNVHDTLGLADDVLAALCPARTGLVRAA